MEPLKPEAKRELTQNNPLASPQDLEQDIEEYERLLSERFTVDPNIPAAHTASNPNLIAAPNALSPEQEREARLKVLYQKLYPARNP